MWKIHAHLWHQCGCLAQGLPPIPDGEQRLQEAAIRLAWAAAAKCGYWIDIQKHCGEPFGLSPYTPPCPSSSFLFSLPLSVLLPSYAVHWKVIPWAPPWRGSCWLSGVFWITQRPRLCSPHSWILVPSRDVLRPISVLPRKLVTIRKSSCCLQDYCFRNS